MFYLETQTLADLSNKSSNLSPPSTGFPQNSALVWRPLFTKPWIILFKDQWNINSQTACGNFMPHEVNSPWGEYAVVTCVEQRTSPVTSANWPKQTSVLQNIFLSKHKKPVINLTFCNARAHTYIQQYFHGCKFSKYKPMYSTLETSQLARRR